MNRKVYKKKKKKKKRKTLFLFLFTPILIVLLATAVYATNLYLKAENIANSSYEALENDVANASSKVENMSILFIGVDDSETRNFNDSTRSDALMLATFNKDTNSVQLLSIPRDSYVYIPEKGYSTKINHAYAYGGAQGSIDTIEHLLDIDVDYYMRMNFHAFIDVVDALGGVKVDVPYAISEMDSSDKKGAIQLEEGLQTLNGEEALAFARTRKQDNDMERGKRQQELIQAIVQKATSVESLTKYVDVIEAIGSNMKTNLTFSQMKSLVAYAIKNTDLSITTSQLQGKDSTINGTYYFTLDDEELEKTRTLLQNHLNGIETNESASEDNGFESVEMQ